MAADNLLLPSSLGAAQHSSLEWIRKDSIEDSSRHRTDFGGWLKLGEGGFGKAFRVQNKVDFQTYALKCIKIDYNHDGNNNNNNNKPNIPHLGGLSIVLREVQALSSLHSDNVVRYYSAWVEKGDDDFFKSTNAQDESSSKRETEWTPSSSSSVHNNISNDPVCHLCKHSYKDWEVGFEHWGLIDAVLQPLDLCIPCYKQSIPESADISKGQISIHEKAYSISDYLFILMEYCELTLSQAVEIAKERNDYVTIWSYFAQSLQGLVHLHGKGTIHRDIKPNNIFVTNRGIVKIGDLGLAKNIDTSIMVDTDEHADPQQQKADDDYHSGNKRQQQGLQQQQQQQSSQIGTFLYTAPEVATGQYNQSCDVFSLGIVLIEIFSKFTTAMERAHVLSHFKMHQQMPPQETSTSEAAISIATTMVAHNPTDRPSCAQVLGELIHRRLYTGETKGLVSDLTQQISHLKLRLHEEEEKSARLVQILKIHGISYNDVDE